MLLVSFLLVIVATIFLLSGLFLTKDLALIFISIACSALAGVVLVVAVMKSRPRPSAVPAADGAGSAAPPQPLTAEAATAERRPAGAGAKTGVREFPIPDYDSLEVVEVLPLLGDLEPAQLEMVRQREASGRAHPWILARVDALLEAEADADTSEHAWAPGPIGTGVTSQGRLLDDEDEDEDEIAEVEPDDADWASPRDRDWAAADFELDSGDDYGDLSAAREFPIDRYDELKVPEILPLLSSLDTEDLKLVREEEAAGKARASVLSRIDSLLARDTGGRAAPAPTRRPAAKGPSKAAANLPIENYDGLTVPQIVANLATLDAAQLRQVRTYEKRHKNRAGVLSKIEGALKQAR
ncbi:MAG TPA: hypothetical protein VHL53_16140 [Acidimicrobiia bacterium]|nr:hypothetical protein [Acidimicrobiia bacterium]